MRMFKILQKFQENWVKFRKNIKKYLNFKKVKHIKTKYRALIILDKIFKKIGSNFKLNLGKFVE